MERTARKIAWIAFWSLAALSTARVTAQDARVTAQDWARDMFDHTSFDLGIVAKGAKVEHSFGVENIYLEDAHIKSAKASCGCTTPEIPAQILKTWKKAYVVAKVDTVNFDGQKDVTIDVVFDKPFPAEVQLSIHCYIRRDVVVQPGAVHFNTAKGAAAQQRVIVRYAGHNNWRIQRVECANPSITGNVVEVARGNGLVTYDLTVNLAANAKAGYSRDELHLVTNDPNPRAQRVPVPVDVLVSAPVTVHPSPLIMEPVAAGKLANPVSRSLVVISPSPFQIIRAESTDPRFQCVCPTGTAGAAATLFRMPVLFYGGDAPGKASTRIRIMTTASPEPLEDDVSIDLTQAADAEKTAEGKPGESTTEQAKPEGGVVDPVFGPPGTASKPPVSSPKEF